MWAGRQGSIQLRDLTGTGWARRPGPYWFRRREISIPRSQSLPLSLTPPMSLCLSAPVTPPRLKPAQTCPGWATAPAGPRAGEEGREKRRCDLAALGQIQGFLLLSCLKSVPHDPHALPLSFMPMTSLPTCPHSPSQPLEMPPFSDFSEH